MTILTTIRNRKLIAALRASPTLLLGAILIGCRHAPLAAKAEAYPVRCTSAIPAADRSNLEHLKDVPVPEIVQFGGLDYINAANKHVNITTWREFVHYRKAGYWDADNSVTIMTSWFWRTRGHIPFLEKAIPARQSFVRSLRPGRALLQLLPLDIVPIQGLDCDDVDNAIKQHKTWLEFYPKTRITEKTGTDLSLQIGSDTASLTILAYGDFNHDGFDDMLVYFLHRVTDGSLCDSGLVVLTRTNATDRLHTVSADF